MKIKPEKISGIRFEYRPAIENRADALELLDVIMGAAFIENLDTALEALKEAIEREVI